MSKEKGTQCMTASTLPMISGASEFFASAIVPTSVAMSGALSAETVAFMAGGAGVGAVFSLWFDNILYNKTNDKFHLDRLLGSAMIFSNLCATGGVVVSAIK